MSDIDRVLLVGVGLKSERIESIKESLAELHELTETAGGVVVGTLTQQLPKWNASTLIGKGKIETLLELIPETKANKVIVDHSLSGVQQRNLEKTLEVPVLDRTVLILDIFAQRAQTREGKLQVELAQILDQRSRMVGAWLGSLSRLGGGIGTRGPGEKALEIDRRTLGRKIDSIKKQLEAVRARRARHRNQRKKNQVPSFALIGYTNAGKSTLLNQLTNSKVYSENQLFATLDPTTRKVFLPDSPMAVITDTVGFIRKLPTKLVEAFKATLEESEEADILMHIIDLSSNEWEVQAKTTMSLIEELGWSEKPIIHVYNKMDQTPAAKQFTVEHLPRAFVSATTGRGIEELKALMALEIQKLTEEFELFFPISEKDLVYELDRETRILKKEVSTQGVVCLANLTPQLLNKWRSYLT